MVSQCVFLPIDLLCVSFCLLYNIHTIFIVTQTINGHLAGYIIRAFIPFSGSVYLDDCPGRKNIPVWMIVFGCVSLVQSIIDIMKRCFGKKKRNDEEEGSVNVCVCVCVCVRERESCC